MHLISTISHNVWCVCFIQLRRLAGGSHKRKGREDALNNIVDILGDDVMEDVRVYRRHYGEDPSIAKLYKVDGVSVATPCLHRTSVLGAIVCIE